MKPLIPVLAALALAGCAAQQAGAPAAGGDKVTISIGSPFKPGHILVDTADRFRQIVEQGSNGRIAVTIDAGTKTESTSTS